MRPEHSIRDYWDIVTSAVAQGQLKDACAMLLAHSEVAGMKQAERDIIKNAFEMHPLHLAKSDPGVYVSNRFQEKDFFQWRLHVDALDRSRFTRATLPMHDIVRLLQGDNETFSRICRENWARMVLSRLFFEAPPTFLLPDIFYLVSHAPRGHVGDEEFKILATETMDGQLGVFLKKFYEKFFTETIGVLSSNDSLYLALQLAVVNLALVLQFAGALSDEIFPTNEVPLAEEITLAFAENFSLYQYPLEV